MVIEERKTEMQEESVQPDNPMMDSIDNLTLPHIYDSKMKIKKCAVGVMEIELDKIQT